MGAPAAPHDMPRSVLEAALAEIDLLNGILAALGCEQGEAALTLADDGTATITPTRRFAALARWRAPSHSHPPPTDRTSSPGSDAPGGPASAAGASSFLLTDSPAAAPAVVGALSGQRDGQVSETTAAEGRAAPMDPPAGGGPAAVPGELPEPGRARRVTVVMPPSLAQIEEAMFLGPSPDPDVAAPEGTAAAGAEPVPRAGGGASLALVSPAA